MLLCRSLAIFKLILPKVSPCSVNKGSPCSPGDQTFRDISETKQSLYDKPLPSLPVATVHIASPLARRSLIDAAERPLARAKSPTHTSPSAEKWPSLSPSRPTTPTTIRGTGGSGVFRPKNPGTANTSHESAPYELAVPLGDGRQLPANDDNASTPTLTADKMSASGHDYVQRCDPFTVSSTDVSEQMSEVDRIFPITSSGIEVSPNQIDAQGCTTPHSIARASPQNPVISKGSCNETKMAETGDARADHASTSTKAQRGDQPRERKPPTSKLPRRRAVTSPHNSSVGASTSSGAAEVPRAHQPKPFCAAPMSSAEALMPRPSATTGASPVVVKHLSDRSPAGENPSAIPRPRPQLRVATHPRHETNLRMASLTQSPELYTTRQSRNQSDASVLGSRIGNAMSPSAGSEVCLANAIYIHDDVEKKPSVDNARSLDLPQEMDTQQKDNVVTWESLVDQSRNVRTSFCRRDIADPFFDTSRQQQLIDKPLNRVRRMSATTPQLGPVLRITDAAEHVIMGDLADGHGEWGGEQAGKRNSLPDLRNTTERKESQALGKHQVRASSPLTRSFMARSLSDPGKRPVAAQVNPSPNIDTRARMLGHDAGATSPSNRYTSGHDESVRESWGRTATHLIMDVDKEWPLKSSHPVANGLCPVMEEEPGERMLSRALSRRPAAEEDVSPNTLPCGPEHLGYTHQRQCTVPTRLLTTSPTSAVGTPPRDPIDPELRQPIVSAASRETPATRQPPPRTSSRSQPPDASLLARAQFNEGTTCAIPNRFAARTQRKREQKLRPAIAGTEDQNHHPDSTSSARKGVVTPCLSETRHELSAKKRMLSGIKNMFQKRSGSKVSLSTRKKQAAASVGSRYAVVGHDGSPSFRQKAPTIPPRSETRRSIVQNESTRRLKAPDPEWLSPAANHDTDLLCHATDLAISSLESARVEENANERDRLLQVSFFCLRSPCA